MDEALFAAMRTVRLDIANGYYLRNLRWRLLHDWGSVWSAFQENQ